jgi:hypothetical protein
VYFKKPVESKKKANNLTGMKGIEGITAKKLFDSNNRA